MNVSRSSSERSVKGRGPLTGIGVLIIALCFASLPSSVVALAIIIGLVVGIGAPLAFLLAWYNGEDLWSWRPRY